MVIIRVVGRVAAFWGVKSITLSLPLPRRRAGRPVGPWVCQCRSTIACLSVHLRTSSYFWSAGVDCRFEHPHLRAGVPRAGRGSNNEEPTPTTSMPKSHIQISMVRYSPMIRRYLSHSWAPRSAILGHDTCEDICHYMGAQNCTKSAFFAVLNPLLCLGAHVSGQISSYHGRETNP